MYDLLVCKYSNIYSVHFSKVFLLNTHLYDRFNLEF